MEVVTATAKDGEAVTLYTTSICTPKDEMLQKVKEDDFVKSFGPLLDYYKDNGTSNEGQDNHWSFNQLDYLLYATNFIIDVYRDHIDITNHMLSLSSRI